MKRFIGRQKEIGILRQSIRDGVKGIMVYGQRQVGKTSLIDEAFSTDEFVLVRHECVKGSYEYNVELLALSAMFGKMERPIRPNGVSWPLKTELLLNNVVRS